MRKLYTLGQLAAFLLLAASAAAQPALDGHSTGSAASGTTVAFTATTIANPEVVIAGASVVATGTTNPGLSISGCSLSWTQLGTTAQFNNATPKGTAVAAWYAIAGSNLAGCTITVTSDQTIGAGRAGYCSFSGANSGNPFDPNFSSAQQTTNSTGSSSTIAMAMTTALAHDTMVTVAGQNSGNGGGIGASSTASLCADITAAGNNLKITYKTFTTTQSSFSIGLNWSQPYWSLIGTALTADAPAGRSRILQ